MLVLVAVVVAIAAILLLVCFTAFRTTTLPERFNDGDYLILQTSDGKSAYHDMIEILRPIQEEYARRHGWSYLYAPGIFYGSWPNNAVFNRYFLLQDLRVQRPSTRWVLYMDADSYFVDLDKDWKHELDPAFMLIACAGSATTRDACNFNNGVFFFHMHHPMAEQFLRDYVKELNRRFPRDGLSQEWTGDQDIMQDLFRWEQYRPYLKTYLGEQHNYFNYEGPHIQQMLRAHNTNDDRLQKSRAIRARFHQESGRG